MSHSNVSEELSVYLYAHIIHTNYIFHSTSNMKIKMLRRKIRDILLRQKKQFLSQNTHTQKKIAT